MVKNAAGFTLIEMLLSVSIMAALAGISLPVLQSFQTRGDLFITSQKTADAIRRAQSYARGGNLDSQWGINVTTTTVTVYKGASYATRDTTYDESFSLPGGVTETNGGEVNFAKLTGAPSTTGSVTFTAPTGSTRSVTINAEGMVT